MQDISRYFEYVDKDDLIKKIVSLEFGKFLAYYADAPEIGVVSSREGRGNKEDGRGRKGDGRGKKQATPTSEGYRKLFINLGKKDGFYPGELMQFLNKNVHGHVAVGHIDLLQTMSYFEVPEEDAERVMKYIDGQRYKNRDVRCNDASEGAHSPKSHAHEPHKSNKSHEANKPHKSDKPHQKEDWMQFLNPKGMKLKGEIPDFSEEGWAIRKPRKKK
jgi:ATP-dependent RNA helicase DeaD